MSRKHPQRIRITFSDNYESRVSSAIDRSYGTQASLTGATGSFACSLTQSLYKYSQHSFMLFTCLQFPVQYLIA